MEADVASELEALRAEVAALKDVQARWRANGLDKLDGGRGQSHGFGAARLGPWGLQLSGDEITRYGGLSTLGGPVTLKPYPGVYLNNTFSRTPNADYPFTAIFGPPDRTFALHSYLSAAALAGMRTLIVSGSSHVDLVASLTGGDAPYDIALTVAVDADGNAFKMNYANVDALLLPARTSDPTSTYGTTDGNLFYRSDTDKLRLRANSAFVNLLTSGDYAPTVLTQTFGATVTNTTAETNLLNYTVAANTLGTKNALRVRMGGYYQNNTGATDTFRLKVIFGTTSLFDDLTIAIPQHTYYRAWHLDIMVYAYNATSVQQLTGVFALSDVVSPTAGFGNLAQVNLIDSALRGQAAEDSTAARALKVSCTHTTASASITLVCEYAIVELMTAP